MTRNYTSVVHVSIDVRLNKNYTIDAFFDKVNTSSTGKEIFQSQLLRCLISQTLYQLCYDPDMRMSCMALALADSNTRIPRLYRSLETVMSPICQAYLECDSLVS